MKTKLLLIVLIFFGILSADSQPTETHNLDWFMGIGTSVDLTIEIGDTVIWTWTSKDHTVENVIGSSVEDFNSGFKSPIGSTFFFKFEKEIGDNDYFCSIHGAANMSGTITVVAEGTLSNKDFSINSFTISPNPVTSILNIKMSKNFIAGNIKVFDILGKQILTIELNPNNLTRINVSNLSNGMYLVKVTSGENTQTKRFIKE